MTIEPKAEYQINTIGFSRAYFEKKYGTATPTIRIEDEDVKVFGKPWGVMQGNPAAILFAARAGLTGLPDEGKVFYGKVKPLNEPFSLGELVHESELVPLEAQP